MKSGQSTRLLAGLAALPVLALFQGCASSLPKGVRTGDARGWSDCCFLSNGRVTATICPEASYGFDGGANVSVFTGGADLPIIEIEPTGPVQAIPPGESRTFRVVWELRRLEQPVRDVRDLARIAREVVVDPGTRTATTKGTEP